MRLPEECVYKMNETIKKINELAYNSGRFYQSQETGFLHLSYHLLSDEVAHAIPLLENVLFALSLLRLKTQESVLEAKVILDKLLHFQTDSGNFPVYIHEYPLCRSYYIGADLLPAFHWILFHFGHILGEQLKKRIQDASHKLLKFNLDMMKEHKASSIIKLKLAASASALGNEEMGQLLLQSLDIDNELFWHIPEQLGEALIAMQMLGKLPKEKLLKTWHPELNCYIGPAIKEHHLAISKELTLYDLYMAAFTQHFPERNSKPSIFHLKGAMIQPEEGFVKETTYPSILEGKVEDTNYSMVQEKNFAYSFIELNENLHSKGFHPFYFIWGKNQFQRTCVMQGGNIESIAFEKKENAIILHIDLHSSYDIDERDASKEICFYTEVDTRSSILVDNQKSTTFLLDQNVLLQNPEMNVSFTFSLEKGEGSFKGHIMRANRPSQKHNALKDRFAAYDWQIALRTLKRSASCKIKVTITYESLA